jgi:prepilin-type processing-associated H-X9-DG protein/prepilin-type N-terminal cleavage/methylation domain-containing protein
MLAAQRRKALSVGFTLVEVLVVMGIIGVLIAILLPTIKGARDRAIGVRCQANLRQLYAAQLSYAGDNRERFAGVVQSADERWERRLGKYLSSSGTAPHELLDCPAAPLTKPAMHTSDYGLNSCLMKANWRARRDAKMDSARIILMGDKSHQFDDYITTDDGWYLIHPGQTGEWYRFPGHRSASTYRHGKDRFANMLMADGHVEIMTPGDLNRDSGHWYWGDNSGLQEISVTGSGCCQ